MSIDYKGMNFIKKGTLTIDLDKLPDYKEFKEPFYEYATKEIADEIGKQKEYKRYITNNKKQTKLQNFKLKPEATSTWKNITENIEDDLIKFNCKQNFGIGRFYGDNTTVKCMKALKHTLYKYEGYIDLDQALGHLRIACEFMKLQNLENSYPHMFYYLNNREKVYEKMTDFYGPELSEKSLMKWIFNAMIYGIKNRLHVLHYYT